MPCPRCKKIFTTNCSLTRHLQEKHWDYTTRIQCELCQKSFSRPEHYQRDVCTLHKQPFKSQPSPCHVIGSKPFDLAVHFQANSEGNTNMGLPTNQSHPMPIIFMDGVDQHGHNEDKKPDFLLLDSELFALLTEFFNNISSWEVFHIMSQF